MTHESATNGVRKRRDRPFPWRCFQCLKEEVYLETIPYAADVKHDGRLHHVEVPALTIPKCRACGEVVFNYGADDQIMEALRAHVRLLTPEQIKAGRKALGLKAKDLAERLGVAAATVSRWEKRMMIQSRAMDNLLRVYFAVPEVRAVLQGPNQDVALGTPSVPRLEAEGPATDPGSRRYGELSMDERVARLKTPDECEQFALNVQPRQPDLARAARRRAVELQAEAHCVNSAAERKALEAVYAYERVLSQKRGKKIRASRTWQMIKRCGIIGAVERAVSRKHDPVGYTVLAEMGMQDLAFEAVVVRYPEVFSKEAVSRSTERLRELDSVNTERPS